MPPSSWVAGCSSCQISCIWGVVHPDGGGDGDPVDAAETLEKLGLDEFVEDWVFNLERNVV